MSERTQYDLASKFWTDITNEALVKNNIPIKLTTWADKNSATPWEGRFKIEPVGVSEAEASKTFESFMDRVGAKADPTVDELLGVVAYYYIMTLTAPDQSVEAMARIAIFSGILNSMGYYFKNPFSN